MSAHLGRGSQGRGVRAIGPFPPALGDWVFLDRPTTSQILILFFVSRPLPLPLPSSSHPALAHRPLVPLFHRQPAPGRPHTSTQHLPPAAPARSLVFGPVVSHPRPWPWPWPTGTAGPPPFGAEFSTAPGSLHLAPSTSTHPSSWTCSTLLPPGHDRDSPNTTTSQNIHNTPSSSICVRCSLGKADLQPCS